MFLSLAFISRGIVVLTWTFVVFHSGVRSFVWVRSDVMVYIPVLASKSQLVNSKIYHWHLKVYNSVVLFLDSCDFICNNNDLVSLLQMNQIKTIAHTIATTHTLNSAQNNFKFVITNLVSIKFMYSSFNTLLQVSYPVLFSYCWVKQCLLNTMVMIDVTEIIKRKWI
jgi:hypothetical protein